MGSGKHIQGEEKGGLQLGVHETQSLFLYCYLLIIVLFSVGTTLNLLLPRTTQLDHCGTGPQQGSLQKTGTKHPGAFACVCTHAHAHAEAAAGRRRASLAPRKRSHFAVSRRNITE